jgi:hypothetical protein
MRFVLVNDRTPRTPSVCTACSRPLESGFLHDLSTRRRYCGIECHPGQAMNGEFIRWLAETNPLALAIGWPKFTADVMSALFDTASRNRAN